MRDYIQRSVYIGSLYIIDKLVIFLRSLRQYPSVKVLQVGQDMEKNEQPIFRSYDVQTMIEIEYKFIRDRGSQSP